MTMQKLAVDRSVTFTNPLDDVAKPGTIAAVVTDTRLTNDGSVTEVDVYEVALDDGSTVRAERATLRVRKDT